LSWALAEQYELQNKYEEVHRVYTSLVDKCGDELDKIEAAIPAESTNTEEKPATEAANGTAVNGSNPTEKQTSKEDSVRTLLKLRIKETGQAWIMYIRFARRAEGFQSARKIFGRARKARLLDWRVYDFAGGQQRYHVS
jgi:cleavage stimulation factor subunit 3